MRTLYLIRHAKSGWDDPSLSDHDRPLNDRGRKDAPMMAERMRQAGHPIDVILTSTARRAERTAMAFAQAYGIRDGDLVRTRGLYHAEAGDFLRIITGIGDAYRHAAVFSHNPGITLVAGGLGVAAIDHMPTCAIFGLVTEAVSWSDFAAAPRRFLFFDWPKNPLHQR
jgi:phosphohistidine phosphatase